MKSKQSKEWKMERVKRVLGVSEEESESVSKLVVRPHRLHIESTFYDDFAVQGIRLHRVQPGLILCSFKVPPRLTDRSGNLAPGAIANIVDILGGLLIHIEGNPVSVSANISICYISTAKVDDELEVTSKLLGQKGLISGTVVTLKKKATGETITQGRQILFSRPASKI